MIDLINVRKTYPNGTVALDDVSLHIDDGEFVFIIGHSGAGKSTLVKLLLREEKATSGTILVSKAEKPKKEGAKRAAYNVGSLPNYLVPRYRRTVGVVFQDFKLFRDKTVFENVAFAMRVIGTPSSVIKQRVPAILATVGLADKQKCFPHELSGGEKQRVALARALANKPQIILADEPTGNIDPKMSLEIMELLMRINQKLGKTVIVVTHEKNFVDYYKQRVVMLDHGHIVEDHVGGYAR
ncbi:MAG: ATP-binding cassette domain-containing protein [Clostridia bacterium]|nr:ATP-binding cassette domain-containing protein [Clostridia bacterium]